MDREGRLAPRSQLKFDPWSFDSTDQLLDILRWSFSFNLLQQICEMDLYLELNPVVLELLCFRRFSWRLCCSIRQNIKFLIRASRHRFDLWIPRKLVSYLIIELVWSLTDQVLLKPFYNHLCYSLIHWFYDPFVQNCQGTVYPQP